MSRHPEKNRIISSYIESKGGLSIYYLVILEKFVLWTKFKNAVLENDNLHLNVHIIYLCWTFLF